MLSPVHLSVRLSLGWISQKRLKLGSCNFHCTVATSIWFLRDKFHPDILTGSPEHRRQTRLGGEKLFCSFMRQYLENGTIEIQPKLLLMTNRKLHMGFRLASKSMTLN